MVFYLPPVIWDTRGHAVLPSSFVNHLLLLYPPMSSRDFYCEIRTNFDRKCTSLLNERYLHRIAIGGSAVRTNWVHTVVSSSSHYHIISGYEITRDLTVRIIHVFANKSSSAHNECFIVKAAAGKRCLMWLWRTSPGGQYSSVLSADWQHLCPPVTTPWTSCLPSSC